MTSALVSSNDTDSSAARTLRLPLFTAVRAAPFVVKLSLLGMFTMFAVALFAPLIAPYNPDDTNIMNSLKAPSWIPGGDPDHLMGTDKLGRDTFSRLIYRKRVSVGLSVLGVVIGGVLGTSLGMPAGFVEGLWDRLVSSMIDIQIAVPFRLMTLLAIAALGTDIWVLIALLGIAGRETYARVVRAQVIAIRARPFVEAAYALGGTHLRVAVRDCPAQPRCNPHRPVHAEFSGHRAARSVAVLPRAGGAAADAVAGAHGER